MVARLAEPDFNVLISQGDWGWPQALREIFKPRAVNLLVAQNASEFVNIIESRRIHTAIVDMDWEKGGLAAIRAIRINHPLLPCIVLVSNAGQWMLSRALELDVFSVIDKPVNMHLLQQQLNRLFVKKYNSDIFQLVRLR
jgi:DNA-binding NtrC family response regulator